MRQPSRSKQATLGDDLGERWMPWRQVLSGPREASQRKGVSEGEAAVGLLNKGKTGYGRV